MCDFSADRSAGRLSMLIGNPSRPGEIFACSTGSSGERLQLTSANEDLFSQIMLGTLEPMPYTGAEGWPMAGWILKPPDFDPTQKYPLIS